MLLALKKQCRKILCRYIENDDNKKRRQKARRKDLSMCSWLCPFIFCDAKKKKEKNTEFNFQESPRHDQTKNEANGQMNIEQTGQSIYSKTFFSQILQFYFSLFMLGLPSRKCSSSDFFRYATLIVSFYLPLDVRIVLLQFLCCWYWIYLNAYTQMFDGFAWCCCPFQMHERKIYSCEF